MSRKLIRSLTGLVAMAVLGVSAVATAAAAPASTTSYRECFPDEWEGQTGTICYTIHSTEKSQDNGKASLVKDSGSMLIEFFDADGNVLFSDKTRWNNTELSKNGELHVAHIKTKVTVAQDGETCRAETNVVYANGAGRHLGPDWEWDCK